MNLKSGLLAAGIALAGISGAATPEVRFDRLLTGSETPLLLASLAPEMAAKTHKVVSGENDWKIAKKYGITVEQLHKANPGTNWRALQIGQSLNIPTSGSSSTAKASSKTHTVQKGENDVTIAKKYGVTASQIHSANPGVDWRKLQIGQKINLPGGAENVGNVPTISTEKAKLRVTANVRTEPTTSSAVRTTADKGTVATVIDRQGAWYELRFPKGTVGWVRGDLLTAVAAGSSASAAKSTVAKADNNPDKVEGILDTANSMLGVRYKWGGTSRSGVDCSGFTTVVFSRNGIKLPRTSIEQSKHGQRVQKEDLQAGDLVFFVTGRNSSRINHVGIYIGDGKFIHSSSYKRKVVVTKLSDYSSAYAGARRVPGLQVKQEAAKEEPVEPIEEIDLDALFPTRVVVAADKTGK